MTITDPVTDDYYSWYDLGCAMLVRGLGVAAVDIGIVVFWSVLEVWG